MDLGKRIRLARLFSNPSRRLCSLAVDHFVSYNVGVPQGLRNVPETLAQLVDLKPDAVTLVKGMAKSAWPPYAGKVPLIVSSICLKLDDTICEKIARPHEALRLGADAIAVAIGVCGPKEGRYLKLLSDTVEEADPLGLPVMAHIYPRDFSGYPRVVHDPESILWAVRCGLECGADVIKVPYTGDVHSFREIVATSPVPVVIAGGPKMETLEEALEMTTGALEAGARGATIGRNIWGAPDPVGAMRAFLRVIHGE